MCLWIFESCLAAYIDEHQFQVLAKPIAAAATSVFREALPLPGHKLRQLIPGATYGSACVKKKESSFMFYKINLRYHISLCDI